MKTITVAGCCFLLFLLGGSTAFAFHALPLDTRLLFTPGSSQLTLRGALENGTVHEYVFDNDVKYSQLDWDVENVFVLGITFSQCLQKGLCLNIGLWNGFNRTSGAMQDYDWLETDSEGNPVWTNYSYHENFLKLHLTLDCNLLFLLAGTEQLSLQMAAGVRFRLVRFEGVGGYYQYYYPPTAAKVELYGHQIHYEPRMFMLYGGLNVFWRPVNILQFGFFMAATPLVFMANIDNHLDSSAPRDYVDYPVLGFYLYGSFTLSLHLVPGVVTFVGAEYTHLPIFKGTTVVKSLISGETDSYPNSGGYSHTLWRVSAGLAFKIQ